MVACAAIQPTISMAALSRARSRAAETSGCRAAASDQVLGPLTTTSTKRKALSSVRVWPLGVIVSRSKPATHCSYTSPVIQPMLRTPSGVATKRVATPLPSAR